MKKFPAGMLALGILLAGCNSPQTPKPDTSGYEIQTAPGWPQSVTLTAPYKTILRVDDQGRWKVAQAPQWLTVTLQRGSTTRSLTMSVPDPAEAVPPEANQAEVSGTVVLQDLDNAALTRQLTVKLDLLSLSGPVPVSATATGLGQSSVSVPGLKAMSTGPGRVMVQYRDGRMDVRTVRDVAQAVEAARQEPGVLFAAPDEKMQGQQAVAAPYLPGDELAPQQWEAPLIGMGAVVQQAKTSSYPNPVTVAVLDGGVMVAHPDLAGRAYTQGDGTMDFVRDPANGDGDGIDTDASDTHNLSSTMSGSHGTHVAGVIAANHQGTGPGTGIVGRTVDAPVKVLSVRVLDQNQNGDTSDVLLGMRYAAGLSVNVGERTYTNPHPARVINLSLGVPLSKISTATRDAICAVVDEVTAKGSVVVAAAGNFATTNDPMYPASCPSAISVASVVLNADRQWSHAPYSNSNPLVTVAAPGGRTSTFYNGQVANGRVVPDGILGSDWDYANQRAIWAWRQGTSQATPTVSGLAALLLSSGLTKTPAETKARIRQTALPVSGISVNEAGAGVVDFAAALSLTATPPQSAQPVIVTITDGAHTYLPQVQGDDAQGYRFSAYLAPGHYVVRGGVDRNQDGHLQPEETTLERQVDLQQDTVW